MEPGEKGFVAMNLADQPGWRVMVATTPPVNEKISRAWCLRLCAWCVVPGQGSSLTELEGLN